MIFWLVKKKYTTGKQKRKTPRRFCVVKFMTLYDMIAFSIETLFTLKKTVNCLANEKKFFFLKNTRAVIIQLVAASYDKNLTARRLLNKIEFIRFQTFRLQIFSFFKYF